MPLPTWTPNTHFVSAHKDWFKINREYQREDDAWSQRDKQYLIDTILKDLDVPKFYLRKLAEKEYEIVDGQQRMQTIWDFREGKFALNGEVSGPDLNAIKYDKLSSDLIEQFDNFQLNCVLLEGYDDDKVRELFGRLQRGKPLNTAERLNAMPGTVTKTMRSLASHHFFTKVAFPLKRYRSYHLVSQMLLLTEEGVRDISPQPLYDFFDTHEKLGNSDDTTRTVKSILDYLDNAFPTKTPEIDKNTWVVDLFLLLTYLKQKFVTIGIEERVFKFFIEFWREVMKARRTRSGERNFLDFVLASASATTGKSSIETRQRIIREEFLSANPELVMLDPRREFDRFEKIAIFRKFGETCQACGKKVSWAEYEADHIFPYSRGGETKLENGQVLCKNCNASKGARV